MNNELLIILATYNGEKYLKSQIDSIFENTYKDFKLFIVDDNSSDNTREILLTYKKVYPEKIYLKFNEINLGVKRNFMFSLLENLDKYEYFMFCDQDDIWKVDKISLSIKKIKEIEDRKKNLPILIHTDLELIDSKGTLLNKSMYKKNNFKYINSLSKLLVENKVTGNTILINSKLAYISCYNIENRVSDIFMHDYYLALIAKSFETLYFIDKPLVLYRQHGNNILGASSKFKNKNEIKNNYKYLVTQANVVKEVLEYYKVNYNLYKTLNVVEDNINLIKMFIRMSKSNIFMRIYYLFKYKFYKSKFLYTLSLLVKL